MGSQKLRLPSSKKFTTSIVRGFESPMDASITTPCPCLDVWQARVSSVLDAASSAGFALPKPLHSLLAALDLQRLPTNTRRAFDTQICCSKR